MSSQNLAADAASSPLKRPDRDDAPVRKSQVPDILAGLDVHGLGRIVEPDGNDASDSVIAAGKEIENLLAGMWKVVRSLRGNGLMQAASKVEEAAEVAQEAQTVLKVEIVDPQLEDLHSGHLLRDYYMESVREARARFLGESSTLALDAPEESVIDDSMSVETEDVVMPDLAAEVAGEISIYRTSDSMESELIGVLRGVSIRDVEAFLRTEEWMYLECAEVRDITAGPLMEGDILCADGRSFALQEVGIIEIENSENQSQGRQSKI